MKSFIVKFFAIGIITLHLGVGSMQQAYSANLIGCITGVSCETEWGRTDHLEAVLFFLLIFPIMALDSDTNVIIDEDSMLEQGFTNMEIEAARNDLTRLSNDIKDGRIVMNKYVSEEGKFIYKEEFCQDFGCSNTFAEIVME